MTDTTALAQRIDQRCLTELSLPASWAAVLDRDAYLRIEADEMEADEL